MLTKSSTLYGQYSTSVLQRLELFQVLNELLSMYHTQLDDDETYTINNIYNINHSKNISNDWNNTNKNNLKLWFLNANIWLKQTHRIIFEEYYIRSAKILNLSNPFLLSNIQTVQSNEINIHNSDNNNNNNNINFETNFHEGGVLINVFSLNFSTFNFNPFIFIYLS
jgi:hypothetical protein